MDGGEEDDPRGGRGPGWGRVRRSGKDKEYQVFYTDITAAVSLS